ncbi:ATP-binding cassette domain-containing protein [Polymorphobacter sp.]|uniref:ATP-binding cassette domain-containing protein n=1 Tax=Polymorphobacter sp. TaxID=1909290 RepID=UPI003F71F463
MEMVSFEGVRVDRGGRAILGPLSLGVAAGELVAVTGASGAGKTTLLRLVNGLVAADAGLVRVEGRDVAGVAGRGAGPGLRRGIGYAAQGVRLFPHWSVAENIGAVPRLLGWGAARVRERVAQLLEMMALPADFGGRMPGQLSGGQASRVGLARALAAGPRLLLLDEPFAALDPETRAGLAERIGVVHRAEGLTVLMVTHDLADALTRAGRVVVMEAGAVVADGAPAALVRSRHPAVRALVDSPMAQARRLVGLG